MIHRADGQRRAAELDVRKGVREGSRARPGHGEHEVEGHAERLGAVDVGEAGRVGDDGLGDEGAPRGRVGLDARAPAPLEHLGHHVPLLADLALPEAAHARDEARVLHHVRHQLGRVAADRVELEAGGGAHEPVEDIVRRESHPVPAPP